MLDYRFRAGAVNPFEPPSFWELFMDLLTVAGVVMLVMWAAGAFMFEAPGIIHLFLTLGVFFIILAAIKRSERARRG